MLSRDQICVTTPTLEISKTLVLFRDPIWSTHTQLNGRIWLCESYWSHNVLRTLPGTRFLTIFLKCEMKIVFVIEVFMLDNLIEWTLIPIVCWCVCYGGVTNERTWTLCKNSLGNQCTFRVTTTKNYTKFSFWTILDRFWLFFDEISMKVW